MIVSHWQVLAIFTIKTAMLVFGIMEISIDDENCTHDLKLEPTWDAALRLLAFVHHITEGSGASVKEVEEKYDSFLQVLRESCQERPTLIISIG